MTRWGFGGRRGTPGEPGRDEIAAAQQVVDMFATEALLALDRYEQSFSADETDRARQTADRFAHWWRKLHMDDVRLGEGGSDAEQILAKAADLSFDPTNEWGLSIEEATAQANNTAALEGRPPLTKGIADFRQEFEDAYGGEASIPSRDDEWLAQSLTRLARAAVLRDVVVRGAQVGVSQPLRAAADEMVRQGQRLTDDRRDLAAQQAAAESAQSQQPAMVDRRGLYGRQAGLTLMYAGYSAGVDLTGAPLWAQIALKAPAVAALIDATRQNWQDHHPAAPSLPSAGLDPAQAELRSVRTDLINNLDRPNPATRRDARTLRTPNHPTGPSR
jgi:hypothetical protein